MTHGFHEIPRGETCPICGHTGRCKRPVGGADTVRLCFRVADEHVEGWHRVKTTGECTTYHRDDAQTAHGSRRREYANLTSAAQEYAKAATRARLEHETGELGVTVASLQAIGAGIDDVGRLCFPEVAANGTVVGINVRLADGRKVVGKGQHRGIIVPKNLTGLSDPVLVVEGPSDTCASLTMGLTVVGRPMAKGGVDFLAELLRDRHDVIVVGENDKRPDGSWPGRDGAEYVARKLAKSWRRPVAWALPPDGSKDIRAYLCQGRGTDPVELGQRLVEHLCSNCQWTVPDQQYESKGRPRQSDLLIQLASRAELFHDGDQAFASVIVEEHRETWALRSKAFRSWLIREYYRRYKGAPNAQAIQDALGVLTCQAQFDGPELATAIRLTQQAGTVYLDLCDSNWRIVEIDARGWRMRKSAEVSVRFIRRRGMLPLPMPVTGGSIDDLRHFVNLPDDDGWVLFCAWLTAALRPVGPYPVLVVNGEQGSAKTSLGRFARELVDPNEAALRRPPRDERDLMIAASNSWVIGFDNVSRLAPWLSDGLCTLATGGGLATRELYSDRDETIFRVTRPILLNGIDEVATRPDLLDRAIMLTLPRIDDDRRRDEVTLHVEFETVWPRVLGALLTGVSTGVRNIGTVQLDRLPRMADFAKWVVAAEPAYRWAPGTFIEAYTGNREGANDLALEASAVAAPLLRLVTERGEWDGTAGELLAHLEQIVDTGTRVRRDWPKTAKGLSSRLRRIAPNLAAAGVVVTFDRESTRGRRRIIRLSENRRIYASEPSAASNDAPGATEDADSVGRTLDARGPSVRANKKLPSLCKNAVSDASDASDTQLRADSADDAPEPVYGTEAEEDVAVWEG